MIGPGFPGPRPTRLPQDNHRLGSLTLLRPRIACLVQVGRFVRRQPLSNPSRHGAAQRYRNINRLCIDYACRPRLSSRLTLGGLAFPRNPWTFGGGFHPLLRYSCLHSHSTTVHAGSHRRFTPRSTLSLPLRKRRNPCFGSELEPRYIVRAGSLDQ